MTTTRTGTRPRHRSAGRRRSLLGALTVTGAAIAIAIGLAPLAATSAAAADRETASVENNAEAWYATQPVSTCPTPLGCLPVDEVSPYPADTLHVGVAGGQETARTYLVPDLSRLPAGATLTGGTMTLPVASDALSGTTQPAGATIAACLVTDPVPDDTAGSTQPPPEVDCKVTAAVKYSEERGGFFTVPLTPFIISWSAGVPMNGIALVPDLEEAGITTLWHVTFDGRDRTDGRPITSAVRYTAPAQTPDASPTPQPTVPPVDTPPLTTGQPPLSSGPGELPTVETTPPAPVAAPPLAQPVAVTAPGFRYPAVFLLPLAFLAAGVFLFRLFTADATPLAVRS